MTSGLNRKRRGRWLGSALFLVIAPGTMAILIPYLLTGWDGGRPAAGRRGSPGRRSRSPAAACSFAAFARFALQGLGTPAPIAPHGAAGGPTASTAASATRCTWRSRPRSSASGSCSAAPCCSPTRWSSRRPRYAFVRGYEEPTLARPLRRGVRALLRRGARLVAEAHREDLTRPAAHVERRRRERSPRPRRSATSLGAPAQQSTRSSASPASTGERDGVLDQPRADPLARPRPRGQQQLDVELGLVDRVHVLGALADDQRPDRAPVVLAPSTARRRPPSREPARPSSRCATSARVPHWPVCPRATIHSDGLVEEPDDRVGVGRPATPDPQRRSSAAWPSVIVKRPS